MLSFYGLAKHAVPLNLLDGQCLIEMKNPLEVYNDTIPETKPYLDIAVRYDGRAKKISAPHLDPDYSLFRSLQGSTVFYPSDAVSCERAVELAANIDGICFIRTGRPADAVIYANDEPMRVGQAKVVRQSSADKVLLIGAGVTLHECLKTADSLATQGVACCVIDPFTIKPLDGGTIREHAKRVGGRVVTVEDHYPEGGIGEAVSAVLSGETGVRVHHIAVTELPRSGPPMELMDKYGITARHIELAVKKLFA